MDFAKKHIHIKPQLLEQLLKKTKRFLDGNSIIEDCLIFPEFLTRLTSIEEPKPEPGYSNFLLTLLVLITIQIPASVEQIAVFLRFIFPAITSEFIQKWKE